MRNTNSNHSASHKAKGRRRPSTKIAGTEQIDQQHPHGLLSIIKEHHDGIRPDIEVLKSERSSIAEKRSALKHFLPMLKVHAHAEQKILYVACEEIKPLKQLANEGYIEHDTAERLLKELEVSGFESKWTDEISAKAKVLVELVEHHIHEEENEFFEKIRGSFTREELVGMAEAYLDAYDVEMVAAEGLGLKIPSFDDFKDSVNKSWKDVYSRVSEKLNDYVNVKGSGSNRKSHS